MTVLAVLPGRARAGDPHLHWHTLDTPHFEINYYDPEGEVAQRVAQAAERAHDALVPVMDWEPTERTQVVLVDWTDEANGSATAVPYNEVRLYVTTPDDLSQLNDYDDWDFALIAHEYTHILHLDHITGLPALINDVIGKTYSPNNVEPRWFIEGFAVLQESAQTTAGRERNSIFDMYLRTAVLQSSNFHGLDQTSNDPLSFPQATTAYLYGSHFMRWLADRYGDDKLAEFSAAYGNKVIPFSLNETARQVFGDTFENLWDVWVASLRDRYALVEKEVEERGLTPFVPLTQSGQFAGAPRFSHDGSRILYLWQDGHHRDGYYSITPGGDDGAGGTPTPTPTLMLEGLDTGAFTPDDRAFVFQRLDIFNTNYFYNDLWTFDLSTGDAHQLTFGLRAAEPDVSPDGKTIVFTANHLGRKTLMTIPIGGGTATDLLPAGAEDTQVYTPVFSHDGTRVAFSAWTTGGYRDLYVLTLATGELERLTADRALDVDPRFSPDDKYLYFCSDRTGIYNLYAFDLTDAKRTLWQVSNVIGGVFQPDISPDGKHAVYSGFAATGYDIHEMDLDPARFLVPEPYIDDRPAAAADTGPTEASPYPSRDYDPLETLWPHAWCIPQAGTNGTFGAYIGGCVSGQDAVGNHAWDLAATWSPSPNIVTGSADYNYFRLWPGLGLHLGRAVYPRGGLFIDGKNNAYLEEALTASAHASLPIVSRIDRALSLSFGYGFTELRDVQHPTVPLDPSAMIPVFPDLGRLAGASVQLSYASVFRTIYGAGPIAGTTLGLGLELDHPSLGSRWSYLVSTAGASHSFTMPWSLDQTLQLRASAGVVTGNFPRGGAFGVGGYGQPETITAYGPQILIFDAIQSLGGGPPPLRGYTPGVRQGSRLFLASAQYQTPLWTFEEGYATLPVYVRRLMGVVYTDTGNAFFGAFHPDQLLWGVGGELRLDMQFGWYVPGTVAVGYAHGITGPAVGQLYIQMGGPL
jgi:hypothetical protein